MPITVFILRTPVGRVIFTLKSDALEIVQKRFGLLETVVVPLRSISPDYEHVARRLPFWSLLPALLTAAALLGAYCLLIWQDVVPSAWAMYPAAFGVLILWGTTRLLRRFDCFVFRDHWKSEIFVIAREEGQATECDAFLHTLLDHIEAAERGSDPPPPVSIGVSHLPVEHTELKWKISLGAGVLATTLPLINLIEPEMTFYVAVVVLGATACSLLATFAAFTQKERMRYWSLLGSALSLVPYVFY
jgi:hypothetical protein